MSLRPTVPPRPRTSIYNPRGLARQAIIQKGLLFAFNQIGSVLIPGDGCGLRFCRAGQIDRRAPWRELVAANAIEQIGVPPLHLDYFGNTGGRTSLKKPSISTNAFSR